MHSYLPLCFMITGQSKDKPKKESWIMCTISSRRSLGTRPAIYKGRRVVQEKS